MTGRGGFALPVAVLLMLVGTVLAMSALHVARSDFEANRSLRLSHDALRAAEAGSTRTLLGWGGTGAGALAPGDSVDTGWVALPGGAAYRTVILRVDDGAGAARFRLRTAGRSDPASSARRVLYTMVEGGGGVVAVGGAMAVQGRLRVRGGAGVSPQVDGADRVPAGWGAACAIPLDDQAGVRIESSGDLTLQAGGAVDGDPAVLQDGSIDNGDFATLAGRAYADLAAGADVAFSGNTTISSFLGPRVAGGQCDESNPLNWGDPTGAGPCGDYLPLIHVSGNLHIDGGGAGQGILLVDGDLRIDGIFAFTGLIVVLGSADLRNLTVVTGGLMVRNGASGNGQTEVRAPARVLYSACALARASEAIQAPGFMAGRHWFDIG